MPRAGTVTLVAPSVNAPPPVSSRFRLTSVEPVLVKVRFFVTAASLGSCGHVWLPKKSDPVPRTVVRTAAATSRRPVPTSYGEYPPSRPFAVLIRCSLSCAPVQSGCCWARIAAPPATCGVAIEVPLRAR